MLEIKFSHKISEIGKDTWNSLCSTDYPFCRYEFLYALEQSGSVCAKTGWQPVHLQLIEDSKTIAVMPLYLKNHSYGEYVFDWAWADAYQRYGLDYYPKLVSAVPYSPVTGPRLLSQRPVQDLMAKIEASIPQICQQLKAHSWHLLFPDIKEHSEENLSVFSRKGCQYQWFNRNYHDFDDFLQHFTSRKRKNVKKERKKIVDQGIQHLAIEGNEISDQQLDEFYDYYRMTYLKRGREAYLSKSFFYLLRELMPDNLLLVVASKDGQSVAGALSLKDSSTLYGRYWGCIDEYDSLHFETCYYQGIDYCINNQLQRFDSGAQGEHKIQRGFEPVATTSRHWLAEKGFNQAIKQFVDEEEQMVDQQLNEFSKYLPFKQQ